MKQIVMSAAYRQSSRVTPELFARDPENRLLARGSRFRLDAEMLRDQALAVSGLLVNKVGGPSVKPPQPDGLWFAVGYSGSNTVRFKKDTGPDKVYRRALYTFIKRTAPPPQMNDPQFVEAARALAGRVMNEKAPAPEATAARIYRIASGRHADEQTTGELVSAYRDHLKTFQAKPDDAKRLISIGESKPDANLDPAQLAAWTMVANLVLNLDAVVSKN
jgi:hypothetical protein